MSRLKSAKRVCAKCGNEVFDEDLCSTHFRQLITHAPVPLAEEPYPHIGDGHRTCKHCRRLYDGDLDKWSMCPVRLHAWQAPRWQKRDANRAPNAALEDYQTGAAARNRCGPTRR
jgi:RNA polymerase subunit RPABC4/transcription elongation factor Spt4